MRGALTSTDGVHKVEVQSDVCGTARRVENQCGLVRAYAPCCGRKRQSVIIYQPGSTFRL